MKFRKFFGFILAASSMTLAVNSPASADYIVGGSLTFNLDGNAFANGADIPLLSSWGVAYDTNQTFMEFGRHFTPSETVGVPVSGFRPEPEPPVTNFDDLRSGWVRPNSDGLEYAINGNSPIPSPQPSGRSAVPTTFAFDPSNVEGTATGLIGTIGSTSFWYANDPIIDTGSIWLGWGDMSLQYSASRDAGDNSGWYFRNRETAGLNIFDIRNLTMFVQGAGENPGTFSLSGDLYTAPEFRNAFAIQQGLKVGTFTLTAQTVPEPASILMLGVGSVLALGYRRRTHRSVR